MKRFIAIITLAAILCVPIYAKDDGFLTGAKNVVTKELSENSGVWHTNALISAKTLYNNKSVDKEINTIEVDLSNTRVSLEALNCGTYLTSAVKLKDQCERYAESFTDKTILAAVNGDLWMTSVHSNGDVTKKVLKVSRGIMISAGEIWASEQIDMENEFATNAEKGTPSPAKSAFGVTSQNQPIVGSPIISISINNLTKNKTVKGDGINRLPANDSIIVYNHRVLDTNYALDDSYEIELESDDTAFRLDGKVNATVKAVYPSGSKKRPKIGDNTIVITARRDAIDKVEGLFDVGDTVTFECGIIDRNGRDELWYDVKEAIGGHMPLKENDITNALSGETEYPVSLIGIKDDGKVLITTLTSSEGERHGANYNTVNRLCDELGYNSVFMLDGGGSATVVTLEDGTYSERSEHWKAENDYRAVINMVAVVLYDEPVCEAQGSLDYIQTAKDLSAFPAAYIPPDMFSYITTGHGALSGRYDEKTDSYVFTTTESSNDPMVSFTLSVFDNLDASEYKYIVMPVRSEKRTGRIGIFYYAGKDTGAAASRYRSVPLENVWQYVIIDLSSASDWKGKINGFRFDPLDNEIVAAGENFYVGGMVFCKTLEEAEWASGGWMPEGAYISYADYLNANNNTEDTDETVSPADENTEHIPTYHTLVIFGAVILVFNLITLVIVRKNKKNEHR